MSAGRKETERSKLLQEKCQTLLTQMLRDEDNKYCVDCDAKGPRWASWNLGVFLCIRCAGIHRNLGVHISRVKSVNLDSWTPEQVISLQQMGNSRARAVYEAQLPDGFRRPQTDTALESFIRAKYEHKKYLAREWVPPSPPKVDWAKEIDEELEKQKRKKKTAQANSGIALVGDSKRNAPNAAAKSTPLPAPLPKPKPNQVGGSSSPKIAHRVQGNNGNSSLNGSGGSSDLLGLSSPTKPTVTASCAQDMQNDSFTSFLSAGNTIATPEKLNGEAAQAQLNVLPNTLAQEEQDFFNQGSLGSCATAEKDQAGKLSKDSILALYGNAPTTHNFVGFTGMAPGGYMQAQQQQQPHHHHQQFMTPPNSVSMYNAPVMAAPNAFSAPSSTMNMVSGVGFGAQFPSAGGSPFASVGGGGSGGASLMQTNQNPMGLGLGMMQPMGAPLATGAAAGGFPNNAGNNASATANLNQQFGNLNIGNVWQ